MDEKTTVKKLRDRALSFRDERDWKQYHDPKNLAAALSIEAGELQELFLWKSKKEVDLFVLSEDGRGRIEEEMADILIYLLYLADSVSIDLSEVVLEKLKLNSKRYPINKSRGSNRKYSDL